MPSHQNSAGAGKAAKFVAANPLGPMADPFSGMGDDEKEYQKEMSENINKRLIKAGKELQEKHAKGTNDIDDPDRAPTGSAYQEQYAIQRRQEKMKQAQAAQSKEEDLKMRLAMKEEAEQMFKKDGSDDEHGNNDLNDSDDDSDDEYNDLLDDDAELEAIRERRIREMRAMQAKQAEHKSLGHGQVRTITQDEFLPECTGKSRFVAVHFFHKEFSRCKIMDHHLKIIAPLHLSCKFLRMDAEKAPFFISKLQIRTLPALFVFEEGKVADKLLGFEGLAINPAEPDQWHTGRLQQWLSTTGAIKYKIPTEEIKEEMKRMGIRPKGTVWSGTARNGFRGENYDEDDEE